MAIEDPDTELEVVLPECPGNELKPPKKICGTDWFAVTSMALQPGWLIGGAMTGLQEVPVYPSAVNLPFA